MKAVIRLTNKELALIFDAKHKDKAFYVLLELLEVEEDLQKLFGTLPIYRVDCNRCIDDSIVEPYIFKGKDGKYVTGTGKKPRGWDEG